MRAYLLLHKFLHRQYFTYRHHLQKIQSRRQITRLNRLHPAACLDVLLLLNLPYEVNDSRAFLSFTTENFRDSDYRVYVRIRQQEKVRDWTRDEMPPRNGVAGYRSFFVPSLSCGAGR
mgnify:CR=1 FL=1